MHVEVDQAWNQHQKHKTRRTGPHDMFQTKRYLQPQPQQTYKKQKKSTDQIIWIKDVFARHLAAKEDFSPANSDLNTHNCILMSTDLFLMAIFFPCISFFSFFFYLESAQTYMNMNILKKSPTFLSSSSTICLASKSKQEVWDSKSKIHFYTQDKEYTRNSRKTEILWTRTLLEVGTFFSSGSSSVRGAEIISVLSASWNEIMNLRRDSHQSILRKWTIHSHVGPLF